MISGKSTRDTLSAGSERLPTGGEREDDFQPYGKLEERGAVKKGLLSGTDGGSSAYRWTMALGGEPDMTKPYAQHPWVYACVAAVGRAASSVPARLQRKLPSGEYETDTGSALTNVLANPNPLMSQRKFFRSIATNHNLYGETFLILLKKNESGDLVPVRSVGRQTGMGAKIEAPDEVWPVRGDLAEPIIDKKTKLPEAWRFQTGGSGGHVDYPAHAIVQIAEVNPYSPLRGMGPMQAAYRTAAKDFIIDRYDEALLQNGGSPGGVLSVKGPIGEPERKAMGAAWHEAHSRTEQHRKIAVLGEGAEYQEIGLSPQAMEHEKLRSWDRQTILSIFGVMPVVLGLETINYATAREQNRIFWEITVLPYLDFLRDELQYKLIRRLDSSDSDLLLDFDISEVSALREDMDAKVDRTLKLYTAGHRTIVESASLAGWDITEKELDGSDERWIQGNLISPAMAAQGKPGVPSSANSADPAPRAVRAADDLGTDDDGELDGSDGVAPDAEAETREAVAPWPADLDTEEKRIEFWKAHTAREDETIAKVAKRTVQVYRDLALSVRKKLTQVAEGAKAVPSMQTRAIPTDAELARLIDLNLAEWGAALAGKIEGPLKLSMVTAGSGIAGEMGVAATITSIADPFVVSFYESLPVYLSEGPTTTLANDIRKAVLSSILEADVGSAATLAEAVREALIEVRAAVDHIIGGLDARAGMIARTETIKANNGARSEEMKRNEVESHKWLSSRDGSVRDAHQTMDGEVAVVGDPFSNGLEYPGDQGADAADVVNCRCTTVAILPEDS